MPKKLKPSLLNLEPTEPKKIKVEISCECACTRRAGCPKTQEFTSREEAYKAGLAIVFEMDKYCCRHRFDLRDNGTDYIIKVT